MINILTVKQFFIFMDTKTSGDFQMTLDGKTSHLSDSVSTQSMSKGCHV